MTRLHTRIAPESYDLRLTVDPNKDRFSGNIRIELRVTSDAREIELHAVDLKIENCTLEDSHGPITIERLQMNPANETVRIELMRSIRGHRAYLEIAYEGPIRADLRGLYQARSGRRRYAATQLEAADARRFFPCFDEPDRKARFRICVTAPARNQVISNAPVEKKRLQGSRSTTQFAWTPRLSTYLIALVVGELEGTRTQRAGSTPIRVWHVPGKKHLTSFALSAAKASIERLEKYFGLPYPYAKLDLIAVPDFEFGAMENAGAVTFRESLLLLDPKRAGLAEKKTRGRSDRARTRPHVVRRPGHDGLVG